MWHVWISSLGVTAAIILAGGYVWLQVMKERHQFQLMQTALERGIPSMVTSTTPSWFVSMRQAVAVFVLGVGLIVVGAVAWKIAANVPPPNPSELAVPTAVAEPAAEEPEPPVAPPPAPPAPPGKHKPPHPRPKPPPPNPALEQWHQAQQQQTVGLVVAGCGLLITLLGAVRMIFAGLERKQFAAANVPAEPPHEQPPADETTQ